MDWVSGTIGVFNNTGDEKSYGCNSSDTVWGYYDELPDFDESLLLDCGKSDKYLTIFDFALNKGIIIPITEELHDELINNSDMMDEYCITYGLHPGSDWMITDEDNIYFTELR